MLAVRTVLAGAVVASALVPSAAGRDDTRIQMDFYTPGFAVMCWEDRNEVQLTCFMPSDGLSIFMYPTGRVPRDGDRHRFSHALVKNPAYGRFKPRDFNRKSGGLLQFGFHWTERQAFWVHYACESERTGLTCRNRSGHGWRLGGFRGNRIF